MKNIKQIIFLISICMVLSGCSTAKQNGSSKDSLKSKQKIILDDGFSVSNYRKNLEPNRIRMSKYLERYPSEMKEIQEKTYSKLDLSGCQYGEFPKADTVSVLKEGLDREISADEGIRLIKKCLREMGYDNFNFKKELKDCSGQLGEKSSGEEWPTVLDQKEKCSSGNGFFINTEQCAVQILGGGVYSMSDGSITKFLHKKSKASMDALGVYSDQIVTGGAIQALGKQNYMLLDRKTAVRDAARMTRKYFDAEMSDRNVSTDIPQVEVFSLKDRYGYDFHVRRVYKGVKFAFADYGGRNTYGDYEILEDIKHAYVVNSKTVAAYAGQNQNMKLDVLLEEDKIIGLDQMLQILDKRLAQHLKMKLDSIEFVYCPLHFEIQKDQKESIIFPFWQMSGKNVNNGQSLRIYVDALTGEIYLYTYY